MASQTFEEKENQIKTLLEKFNEETVAYNEHCKTFTNDLKNLIKELTKEMCSQAECGLDKCERKQMEKKIGKYKDFKKNICCNCNAGFSKCMQRQMCEDQGAGRSH